MVIPARENVLCSLMAKEQEKKRGREKGTVSIYQAGPVQLCQPCKNSIIISIMCMKELRLRETKYFVKDIVAIKNLTKVFRTSNVLFLKQYYPCQDLWTFKSKMRSQSKQICLDNQSQWPVAVLSTVNIYLPTFSSPPQKVEQGISSSAFGHSNFFFICSYC